MKTNIEPGCLCMVTDPSNYGVAVTALKNIGPVLEGGSFTAKAVSGCPIWEIDRKLDWPAGIRIPYCDEDSLMRIDTNPDEETIMDKEEVL